MMMSLIFGLVGILIWRLGQQLWKEEKIGLLQEYHRDKVSEKDKNKFCDQCGLGMCIIGAGMLLTALLYVFLRNLWPLSAFAGGLLIGLGMMIRAIRKYNR